MYSRSGHEHEIMAAKRATPDLTKRLRSLQRKYFPGHTTNLPVIVWSHPVRKVKECCLFGCYKPAQNFIYINWVLSQAWVPDYFLDFIVFHELCHWLQDEIPLRGETAHSPRFVEWEQRFKHYAKARKWEQKNVMRIFKEINKLIRF